MKTSQDILRRQENAARQELRRLVSDRQAGLLEDARRWRPWWGDVNQMHQDGADVRGWVAAGLAGPDLRAAPAPPQRKGLASLLAAHLPCSLDDWPDLRNRLGLPADVRLEWPEGLFSCLSLLRGGSGRRPVGRPPGGYPAPAALVGRSSGYRTSRPRAETNSLGVIILIPSYASRSNRSRSPLTR